MADGERQKPTYPFRVERSAEQGRTIGGANGDVIYRERSLGREAAYLTAPMPAGQWPISLGTREPLFPLSFVEKGVVSVYYCSNRFRRVRNPPIETVCFQDRDKDGRFDAAVIGERNSGFVFEITGHWMEATGEDIEGSRVIRVGMPRAITPTPYAIKQIRPAPGEGGVIELRYAGLRRGVPAFDASFRAVADNKVLYTTQISATKQPDTRLPRATIPHPVVAYRASLVPPRRMGLAGPFPETPNPVPKDAAAIAAMIVEVAKADAKHVRATIVRAFAPWSWYRQNCADDEPELVYVDDGRLPALYSGQPVGLCEKTSWAQNGQWHIVGPVNANSGPIKK
ncbi:MAG: hypothetical protein GC190_16390 [Alphaproteobacteria bacterium]|nr:hypothetical protein [Alphaproteobacteria bacterium]